MPATTGSVGRGVKSKNPSEIVLVFLLCFCFVCFCRGAVLPGSGSCEFQEAADAWTQCSKCRVFVSSGVGQCGLEGPQVCCN